MAQGIVQAMMNSIQKLMRNQNMTMYQAMNVLEVPEQERQKYADLLAEQYKEAEGKYTGAR